MNNIQYITREQMIEVDNLMVNFYKIKLIQMMENAGRNLAILSRDKFLNGNVENKKILVLAGTGGNGGGALVCARRLYNWGANVELILSKKEEFFKGVIKHQLDTLNKLGIKIYTNVDDINNDFSLIIDGLVGYSLKGELKESLIKLIDWINKQDSKVISLDIPTGMDSNTGKIANSCIKANATLTLALPKTCFLNNDVKKYYGELYLADIGVPDELYKKMNIDIDKYIFAKNEIIKLK